MPTGGVHAGVTGLLDSGRCEPLKACVHTAALIIAGLCATYNTAAWLKRRQPHLAVNAIVYLTAVWWERCHVMHHLAACSPSATDLTDLSEGRLSDAA